MRAARSIHRITGSTRHSPGMGTHVGTYRNLRTCGALETATRPNVLIARRATTAVVVVGMALARPPLLAPIEQRKWLMACSSARAGDRSTSGKRTPTTQSETAGGRMCQTGQIRPIDGARGSSGWMDG